MDYVQQLRCITKGYAKCSDTPQYEEICSILFQTKNGYLDVRTSRGYVGVHPT